jgi:hypothetical protein
LIAEKILPHRGGATYRRREQARKQRRSTQESLTCAKLGLTLTVAFRRRFVRNFEEVSLLKVVNMKYPNVISTGLIWSLLSLLLAAPASAAPYDETASGDLSNNQLTPTASNLYLGSNLVTGSAGGADSQDFIAVKVPTGFVLDAYVHVAYTGSDAQGFTGFQSGSTFPGNPFVAGSYAGYAHYGTGATNPGVNGGNPTSTVGLNLLPAPYMADNSPTGTAAGATGFTAPLGAGFYTFLIQQLGGSINYQFDFHVKSATHDGDFDGDGDVDGADFVAWQTTFPRPPTIDPEQGGDGDGDTDVDGADFVVWQTNFPYVPGPGSSPVPEPSAAVIAIVGLLGVAVWRKRN